MRLLHFETFKPICPCCRPRGEQRLQIGIVDRRDGETIREGTLNCPNPECRREYPIIDGVPLIVPALRSFVADNLLPIMARRDLGETIESILGDCTGQGSAFDTARNHLSSYTWDHYGEFDPRESPEEPRPGAISRLLTTGLAALGNAPKTPALDVGCSVGRTTFDLAAATGGPTLGIDLNFAKLRLAAEILRDGVVRYPRRRLGLVFDRREFPVSFAYRDQVDFWACDATALPLPESSCAFASSMNLLDSIHSPIDHLRSLVHVLAPGGQAIIGCPYDWSTGATPIEGWLGGHSQRGEGGGAAEPLVRSLLAAGTAPHSLTGLHLRTELPAIPWQVRLHDRSTMSYKVHLLIAEIRKS